MGEGFLKEVTLSSEGDESQLGEEQEKGHSNSRNSMCRDIEHETGSSRELKEMGRWKEVEGARKA